MKKKLLPFILGCAMVATMPLAAHATTNVEYANEISTGTTPQSGDESLNGFTEYNDVTSTENTVDKVFGSGANALGNTRNTPSAMQTGYPITLQNEQQDYRDGSQIRSLVGDIDDTNTDFADQTNDTAGITDLETSVPEFDMKIPASTVLPIGATAWRIGNVEIHGRYFVRPDKVKVVTTHEAFHHSDWAEHHGEWNSNQQTAHSIDFTVTDSKSGSSIEGADKFYFQDGGENQPTTFPYAYTSYTSTNYQNGLVSEINETHQVWVKPAGWTDKTAGKYTGKITFEASVVTNDTETDANMYTSTYPAEA